MNNAEFQEFYEKYYEFSTRIANKIVKSHVVAEDISQETFFNLYKIKDALDCSSELRLQGLVAKAVVNKARDYLRKNYTKREILQMDQIGQEKYMESVEDQFLDVEKKKYMFKALENLRKKNKKNYEIYVAIKILDIPPERVALVYKMSKNNVNNRIYRTKQWLMEEYTRIYDSFG